MVLTLNNIVVVNCNIIIAIRSTLFMPEADHVTKLVYHNMFIIAAIANRDLSFPSFVTNVSSPAPVVLIMHYLLGWFWNYARGERL